MKSIISLALLTLPLLLTATTVSGASSAPYFIEQNEMYKTLTLFTNDVYYTASPTEDMYVNINTEFSAFYTGPNKQVNVYARDVGGEMKFIETDEIKNFFPLNPLTAFPTKIFIPQGNRQYWFQIVEPAEADTYTYFTLSNMERGIHF